MSTRVQILVLSLAVGLLQGCASFGTALRSGQFPTASTQETQADASPPQTPTLESQMKASSAPLDNSDSHDEAGWFEPATLDDGSSDESNPAPNSGRQEARKKTSREPSVSRNSSGPRVEDPFLRGLESDLNKSMEPPVERLRLEFSKAVIENPRVRYFINQFSKSGKNDLEKALARSGKYLAMIMKVLREEKVPEELAYLALIESAFVTHSSSPSGAVGLWQFVPGTARQYGLRIDSWVDERRDPAKSTRAAAAYLKDLHDYFGRWYLALAAYNAGQGNIDKAMQSSGATDFWTLSVKAKLKDETRNFVPKFVAASLIASNPQKYGFESLDYESPLDYEEIKVQGSLRLTALAKMAGTDQDTIRELNPELRRNQIPWTEGGFRVKLPAGHATIFALAYQQQESKEAELVTHEVKKGETLFSIARRYGQRVKFLMELNGLANPTLRVGQRLKVIINGLRGGIR